MPELLKKIPENLRRLYFEQLYNFEQAREKNLKDQSIIKNIICLAVCFGFLFFCWINWSGWNWFGLKGVTSAVMFLIPLSMFKKSNAVLAAFYWCAAFLSFMIPSWDEYSWFGWRSVIILAVVVVFASLGAWFEERKRAAAYVKDFKNFTEQCSEYQIFKNSIERA